MNHNTEKEFEFHEAANIFPLDEENLDELANDIRQQGQQVTIEILDGRILDGRRRYLACKKVGIIPRSMEINVDDPVAYVRSLNLHRRHLTSSQRSMCAARAKSLIEKYEAEAKERMKEAASRGGKASGVSRRGEMNGLGICPDRSPDTGNARDKVGEMFGVDGRAVGSAQKVLKDGVPELAKAVDDGRMGVRTAADLTSEPEDIQRQKASQPSAKRTSSTNGATKDIPQAKTQSDEEITLQGVGVMRAHEAINCLKRIPKNDALRKRGFQVVTDWIRHNH